MTSSFWRKWSCNYKSTNKLKIHIEQTFIRNQWQIIHELLTFENILKISENRQDIVIFWPLPKIHCILSVFNVFWPEKNGKKGEILDKIVYFEKFECFPQKSYYKSFERCSTLKICQKMSNRLKLKVKKTKLTAIYSVWDFWKIFELEIGSRKQRTNATISINLRNKNAFWNCDKQRIF